MTVSTLKETGEGENPSQNLARCLVSSFGQLSNGKTASLYTLTNINGMTLKITDFGGVIVSLSCADRHGDFADVVLGYDKVSDYEQDPFYLGAVIGRYANRIEHGQFSLAGCNYQLTINNDGNHLHGGLNGFNQKLWHAQVSQSSDSASVMLTMVSPDGEQGYPGELTVRVCYTLTDQNALVIDYQATTTKTTIINLTQHSYFNLAGHDHGSIVDHRLMINAKNYLPIKANAIPTGEIKCVHNTPFDFTRAKEIGRDVNSKNEQIKLAQGYDHYWLFDKPVINGLEAAAQVFEPDSGRRLTLYTDQPGVQLYTGNFLDGTLPGKGNCHYPQRSGFCLETQHPANAPNQSDFATTRLEPNQKFSSSTTFIFETNNHNNNAVRKSCSSYQA